LCAAFVVFLGLLQMPKFKPNKGIKKRFKVTAKGKLRYKRPGAGHLMKSKNAKRRRRLNGPGVITGVYAEKLLMGLGK
jgi:large subunit ribosomal protein L35